MGRILTLFPNKIEIDIAIHICKHKITMAMCIFPALIDNQ